MVCIIVGKEHESIAGECVGLFFAGENEQVEDRRVEVEVSQDLEFEGLGVEGGGTGRVVAAEPGHCVVVAGCYCFCFIYLLYQALSNYFMEHINTAYRNYKDELLYLMDWGNRVRIATNAD